MNNPSDEEKSYTFQVASFYCFFPLPNSEIDSIIDSLLIKAKKINLKGTILIASEGINGTICGQKEEVRLMLIDLESLVENGSLDIKISWTPTQAFKRLKIRRKSEIVTMGVPAVDPNKSVGDYVDPSDWNSFVDDPNTLVIDTRNKYEVSIGTFTGSYNPQTENFRDFPSWVDNHLHSLLKNKNANRIAMFCTGGIRCEKATSYLKQEGFKEVHHLKGGILRYLEDVPKSISRWQGECFVFDQRVSLNHKLAPGIHQLCYACGMPLSPEERKNINYIPGIQCNFCKGQYSELDRERFAERHKQYLSRNVKLSL